MADNYTNDTLKINNMLENMFLERFVVPICNALSEKYPLFQETPNSLMEIVTKRTGMQFSEQPKKKLTQSITGTSCQVPIKCGKNKGEPCGKGVKGINPDGLPSCLRHIGTGVNKSVGSSSGRSNFINPPSDIGGFPPSQFAPMTANNFIPQSQFSSIDQQIPVNIGAIPVNDGNRLQIHTTKIQGSNEYYDPSTNIIYKMINNIPCAFARYDENHNVLALREKEISICTVNGASYSLTDPLELTKEVEAIMKPQFSISRGFGMPAATSDFSLPPATNKFSAVGTTRNSYIPPRASVTNNTGFSQFDASKFQRPSSQIPSQRRSPSMQISNQSLETSNMIRSNFIKANEPTTFSSFAP